MSLPRQDEPNWDRAATTKGGLSISCSFLQHLISHSHSFADLAVNHSRFKYARRCHCSSSLAPRAPSDHYNPSTQSLIRRVSSHLPRGTFTPWLRSLPTLIALPTTVLPFYLRLISSNHSARASLTSMPEMASTPRSSSDSLDYTTEDKPNMNAPTWAKPRSSSVISQTLVPPPVQESRLKTKLINGAYIAMNTFSTVAIVFLNKVYVDTLALPGSLD